jgi:hypothetical protein
MGEARMDYGWLPASHYAEGEVTNSWIARSDQPITENCLSESAVFRRDNWPSLKIASRETNSFVMNSESRFEILYYPGAEYTRISPRRMPHHGQDAPHMARTRVHGLHRRNIYHKNKILWGIVLVLDEVYTTLCFLAGFAIKDTKRNCETTVAAMMRFGEIHETANQVFKRVLAKKTSTEASSNIKAFW